ncbi:ribulose-5-phosphate 3-epimerase [Micromonospora avicenniae]|uniref:Ribulose-phosphate 3-epimerase n=2 Tax=Micromonospora TaxID=1873 RepID=A0A1N7DKX8_9ACTN|nr:ribulose-5-phosphate 3-epimerase [Micromonospora avicenniae]
MRHRPEWSVAGFAPIGRSRVAVRPESARAGRLGTGGSCRVALRPGSCRGGGDRRRRSYTCPVTVPPPIVAPSILAADFAHLADEVRAVEGAADWLHVDVMDNHFVPNLTIGLPVVQSLRAATELPFDVHLMIEDPRRWAPGYADAGAYNVTFHAEACDDPVALAKDLRSAGAKAGLAIDRDTPIEPYLDLLPSFDTLLIMTIKAGFGGQRFIPQLLEKVRAARRHVAAGHLELRIEVDGGIAADTIEQAAAAGADAFVAGTAVYGADDPAEAVRRLRALAERATSGA